MGLIALGAGFLAITALIDHLTRRSVAMRFVSFIALVIVAAYAMTAMMCHPGFFSAFNETGQCSASDAPSEVFGSFLLIFFFIALLAYALSGVLRKVLS